MRKAISEIVSALCDAPSVVAKSTPYYFLLFITIVNANTHLDQVYLDTVFSIDCTNANTSLARALDEHVWPDHCVQHNTQTALHPHH